jgi:hypothetical protein
MTVDEAIKQATCSRGMYKGKPLAYPPGDRFAKAAWMALTNKQVHPFYFLGGLNREKLVYIETKRRMNDEIERQTD